MDVSAPRVTAASNADDLGKIPIERVLSALAVTAARGLASAEAQKRLAKDGPNALVETEKSSPPRSLSISPGPLPT